METRRGFVGLVPASLAVLVAGCLHGEDEDVVPVSDATVHDGGSFRRGDLEYQVEGEIRTEAMPSVHVDLTITNHGESDVDIEDDFVVLDEDHNVYRSQETSGFDVYDRLEPAESAEYVLSFTVPADRLEEPYYFGLDGDYVRIETGEGE